MTSCPFRGLEDRRLRCTAELALLITVLQVACGGRRAYWHPLLLQRRARLSWVLPNAGPLGAP